MKYQALDGCLAELPESILALTNRLFRLLTLGEIQESALSGRLSLIFDHDAEHQNVKRRTVLLKHARFVLVRDILSGSSTTDYIGDMLAFIWMYKIHDRATNCLRNIVSEQAGGFPADITDDPILIDKDTNRSVVGDGLEFFLRLFYCLFCPLADSDIFVHSQHCNDLTIFAHWNFACAKPDCGTVRCGLELFVIKFSFAAFHDQLIVCAIKFCLFLPRHVKVGLTDDLFGRGKTGIFCKSPIASQINQVTILPKHSLRDVIHDQRQQLQPALCKLLNGFVSVACRLIYSFHSLPPTASMRIESQEESVRFYR